MKFSRFAALALVLASCGKGNARETGASVASDAISTTVSTGQTGVAPTVPVLTTPVPAAEPGGLDTIEAANQNLWDAWRDDDRPRALAYATTAAVESLFLSKWGPEVRNQGCGVASGIPRCVYTLRGGAHVVVMGQNATGFFAQRVETVGALPSSNRLQSEIVDDTVVFDETADPSLSSEAIGTAVESQDGLEPPLTLAPGFEDLSDGTIDGSGGTEGGAIAGTSGPNSTVKPRVKRSVRKTAKAPKKTTRRQETTASSSAEQSPEPAAPPPAPPSPEPAPAPEPGPVQAGRTVETVAP